MKLSSHMTIYQAHWKEETFSKQVKGTISRSGQDRAAVLNAYFEQVSIKSKIAKQYMYN